MLAAMDIVVLGIAGSVVHTLRLSVPMEVYFLEAPVAVARRVISPESSPRRNCGMMALT